MCPFRAGSLEHVDGSVHRRRAAERAGRLKKWLSYRERALLGRDLKPDEARYVTEMTRRIAAILLLEPALDESYERVKADTYPWPPVSA